MSLSVEPGAEVTRGTNVTLRCKALVSSSGQVAVTREYTISKDGSTIYTKTSISSEDLLYPLPHSRFSNSGRYQCSVRIEDKRMSSQVQKLTVTGGSDAGGPMFTMFTSVDDNTHLLSRTV